jgi:Fur family peroxide stress response transcriptional regulator
MGANCQILDHEIKKRGLRMTRQRAIILDILSQAREHPGASEIYQQVRKLIPSISFGTVYRSLKLLEELGLTRELHFGKCRSRFDRNPANHQHFYCSRCGRVVDIDQQLPVSIEGIKVGGEDVLVTDFRLEFYGECLDCRTNAGGNSPGSSIHDD